MKKTLSLLLVLAMVLSSFGFAFAAEPEKNAGEVLADLGVLKGNAEGDLMLEDELSRQDMVVLLSRLLGKEEEAEAFAGKTTFEDVKDPYYVHFVAWAEANELTKGVGEGKFGFGRPVTEQEVAQFMLYALGYNDVKWEDVAKKAAELGLVAKDADLTVNAKRSKMAEIALAAIGTKVNGEEKTLAEKLGLTLPGPVEATKVESVSASNLKEIVVKFDGEVDANSAEDVNNYSTNAGTIDDAVLSEDLTTVVLTLEGSMTNQKEYTLSVVGVKAGNKKVSADKIKFAPLDNSLPEVVEVKALGTKAIKVVASEPIKAATNSMFKLDGKSYFGTVKIDGREIVLKPYNSTSVLKPGDHKLTASKLEDYYGLKSLEQEMDFVVVEDKDAPVVTDVTATLEKAIVTFDEDVDPDTVAKTGFYWMSGSVKKYASGVVVSGSKVVVDFTGNPLPAYETTLYINGVGDYSGNKVAGLEVKVTATVDQTRPEVVDVKVSKDAQTITVKFSKNVDGSNKANYVVKNEKGKVVSVKGVSKVSAKEYKVNLYNALPAGINTITISGIADTTALKNVMLPFTTELIVGDTAHPEAGKFVATAYGRQIIITFDKAMDLASIADPNKYLIEVEDEAKSWVRLPEGTEIDPINDGKAVRIVLPEYLNEEKNIKYEVGKNVLQIQLMGLVDTAGNMMNPYIQIVELKHEAAVVAKYDDNAEYVDDNGNKITQYAALVDGKTIKVKFDQAIGEATNTDIKVVSNGSNIVSSVDADETSIVTVKLSKSLGTDLTGLTNIEIVDGNKMKTVTGNSVQKKTIAAANVADRVKPVVDIAEDVTTVEVKNNEIVLPFTEKLKADPNGLYAFDLIVTRQVDNEDLTANTHYTTRLSDDAKAIVISFTEAGLGDADSIYTVKVKENVDFIADKAGNKADESEVYETNGELLSAEKAANQAAVNEAKAAVEKATFEAVAQADVNTEEAANEKVDEVIKALDLKGAKYEITKVSFKAAVEGTAEKKEGINGSYVFKVKLSKGEGATLAEATTNDLKLNITATPAE